MEVTAGKVALAIGLYLLWREVFRQKADAQAAPPPTNFVATPQEAAQNPPAPQEGVGQPWQQGG